MVSLVVISLLCVFKILLFSLIVPPSYFCTNIMKVSEGFTMADSRNLPKVDYMMLLQYMRENDTFNVAEIRGAKVLMSSRDAYVETSVGFVELKRDNPLCHVKGKVTPEHRVRCKLYTVVAILNEVNESIVEVRCEDCAAGAGGCKHAICFVMWLIKRTEEPSPTSVSCYWARPKLSEAVTQNKCIMAKELGKRKQLNILTLPPALKMTVFLSQCKKQKVNNSLIINYNNKGHNMDRYSIYQIMLDFATKFPAAKHNFESLKIFAQKILTTEAMDNIEEQTRGQAGCKLWHTLKQGRVSASKIHDFNVCQTDGVLVKSILGGYKVPETKAIKRGKALEREVIKEIEKTMKIEVKQCGFILMTPFIGASPDGVSEEFSIEIKCPFSENTMANYVKDNNLAAKWKAQTQLQMCATNKKKALFCVADPKFEENKKIYTYWQYYDKMYVNQLISKAEQVWKEYIFEKMTAIVES